jgi:hypothetical protein
MKKTLNIEDKLLKEAKLASGAPSDTETVRLGIEALVRRRTPHWRSWRPCEAGNERKRPAHLPQSAPETRKWPPN